VRMPKSKIQASTAPPAPVPKVPRGRSGQVSAPMEAAVVETVRVPLAAPLVMLTGDVPPKLKVGGSAAPAGLVASAAVRVTLPVNPPLGVTVIVAVLPVVAPGELMVRGPPFDNVKPGAT
jgi:hypothetical protein